MHRPPPSEPTVSLRHQTWRLKSWHAQLQCLPRWFVCLLVCPPLVVLCVFHP